MAIQCECTHTLEQHPGQVIKTPGVVGLVHPCGECDCKSYKEDRNAVTDSERLMRIEDMLTKVLSKLKG